MKGYLTGNGYMGYVNGRYMLFPSEDEYMDYIDEGTLQTGILEKAE